MPTFDAKNVLITFGGAILRGFGEDDFCTIEYNSPRYTLRMGADGASTRSKTNDGSAKITITCAPGSAANVILQAAAMADDAANAGELPFECFERMTGTTHAALKAWIVKTPGAQYGKESKDKVWELEAADMKEKQGVSLEL